jgi:phosphoribosylglycinamide formyltransferase-1
MTYSIGVLVSGRGTNLQAILDACAAGAVDARVVFVASNRDGAPALIRAERAGVRNAAFTVEKYKTRAAAHGAIADSLVMHGARLVVLAGFDHILSPIFFVKLAGIPVINIHPALLPFFGGKGMTGDKVHAAVLAAKAKESGVTVHRVHPDTVDIVSPRARQSRCVTSFFARSMTNAASSIPLGPCTFTQPTASP